MEGATRKEADVHRVRPLRQVSDRVNVATARLWTTTSTVIVDGADALVVDPAMTVAEVDALAATLRGRGWQVLAGFSTHPHWDHLLRTAALGDVPRWATADGVRVAAERSAPARAECTQVAPATTSRS